MLGNGVCDNSCLTSNCNYDYGDFKYCTATLINVSSLASGAMTGSSSQPYGDILQGIQSIHTPYTNAIIYLWGSNFTINGSVSANPLASLGEYSYIQIEPYYCSQGIILNCFQTGVLPVLTFNNVSTTFNILGTLVIKNVIFSHAWQFDSTCPGCYYCPYTTTNNQGQTVDDRGNAKYLDSRFCGPYMSFNFFYVNMYASLYLNVIIT